MIFQVFALSYETKLINLYHDENDWGNYNMIEFIELRFQLSLLGFSKKLFLLFQVWLYVGNKFTIFKNLKLWKWFTNGSQIILIADKFAFKCLNSCFNDQSHPFLELLLFLTCWVNIYTVFLFARLFHLRLRKPTLCPFRFSRKWCGY